MDILPEVIDGTDHDPMGTVRLERTSATAAEQGPLGLAPPLSTHTEFEIHQTATQHHPR